MQRHGTCLVVPAGAGCYHSPLDAAGDAAKHPAVHSMGPPPLSLHIPATKNCPAPVPVVLWEIKLMQTYPFMPVCVVFRKARFQVTRRADPAFLLPPMFHKSGGRGVCVCMFHSCNWKKLRQLYRCSSELP